MHLWEYPVDGALTRPLGWMLVHFLWQGALIAALGVIATACVRSRSAQTRYIVHCLTLLTMAACPAATFAGLAAQDGLFSSATPVRIEGSAAQLAMVAPFAATHAATAPIDDPTPFGQTGATTRGPLGRVEDRLPWVVTFWLSGVCLLALRLGGAGIAVAWMKRKYADRVEPDLEAQFARLCERIGLRRRVELRTTTRLQTPVAIGCFRAMVLLPASALTGLPPDQIEALLAHELAHIRRYDHLLNLWQTAMETILFYHPAVWWVSSRIRVEREHCCDDMVVALLDNRLTYARALTTLEEMRGGRPALGMAANGGDLLTRIRRIAGVPDPGAGRQPVGAFGSLLMLSLLVGLFAWTIQVSRAQSTAANTTSGQQTPSASELLNTWQQAVDNLQSGIRSYHMEGRVTNVPASALRLPWKAGPHTTSWSVNENGDRFRGELRGATDTQEELDYAYDGSRWYQYCKSDDPHQGVDERGWIMRHPERKVPQPSGIRSMAEDNFRYSYAWPLRLGDLYAAPMEAGPIGSTLFTLSQFKTHATELSVTGPDTVGGQSCFCLNFKPQRLAGGQELHEKVWFASMPNGTTAPVRFELRTAAPAIGITSRNALAYTAFRTEGKAAFPTRWIITEDLSPRGSNLRIGARTYETSISVSRENAVASAADFQIVYPASAELLVEDSWRHGSGWGKRRAAEAANAGASSGANVSAIVMGLACALAALWFGKRRWTSHLAAPPYSPTRKRPFDRWRENLLGATARHRNINKLLVTIAATGVGAAVGAGAGAIASELLLPTDSVLVAIPVGCLGAAIGLVAALSEVLCKEAVCLKCWTALDAQACERRGRRVLCPLGHIARQVYSFRTAVTAGFLSAGIWLIFLGIFDLAFANMNVVIGNRTYDVQTAITAFGCLWLGWWIVRGAQAYRWSHGPEVTRSLGHSATGLCIGAALCVTLVTTAFVSKIISVNVPATSRHYTRRPGISAAAPLHVGTYIRLGFEAIPSLKRRSERLKPIAYRDECLVFKT